jgi:hypothetical protein
MKLYLGTIELRETGAAEVEYAGYGKYRHYGGSGTMIDVAGFLMLSPPLSQDLRFLNIGEGDGDGRGGGWEGRGGEGRGER